MCLWKELYWKFNEVKCLLLPAPEQLLSSSLGVFPSFPEGTQLIPKLPGASIQPFTQSHCRLLEQLTCPDAWPATGKAAVRAHRPCLATQELSPEGEVGATAHLATAGHWEVSWEGPGVYKPSPSILNSAEQGFGGGRCILVSKLAVLCTKMGI